MQPKGSRTHGNRSMRVGLLKMITKQIGVLNIVHSVEHISQQDTAVYPVINHTGAIVGDRLP